MGHHQVIGSQGMNLEFHQGAVDGSPPLHEGHRGIFNIHQLMLEDRTVRLSSIRGMDIKLGVPSAGISWWVLKIPRCHSRMVGELSPASCTN